jgi:4-hydroxy-4-methyl-2-oxoglutarate aldolase
VSDDELARLGTATVYEAAGREGLIDIELHRIVPGSRAAGPALTVACGPDDNLMVHAAMDRVRPGDVLVITIPVPGPVALVGDLLATQALTQGAAAMLIDAAVRDVDELAELGLPIWARWVRVRGATKTAVGTVGEPVSIGGVRVATGDRIVLDGDGTVAVRSDRVEAVLAAAREREASEASRRARFRGGALSYDLDDLRARVEGRRA